MRSALLRSPWAAAAAAAGAAGLVALLPGVPAFITAPLVAVAVLLGPGALLLTGVRLPRSLAIAVVPAIGIAVVVLVSTAMSMTGLWFPQLLLAALGGVSAVGGALQLARSAGAREAVR